MYSVPPRTYRSRSARTGTIYKKKKKRITLKRVIYVLIALVLLYFALFLIVVPERPDYAVLDQTSPVVIAHRGGAALAPENTLIAFRKAQSLGVDMLEYDVHMTKDGHLVVIHDETVDRTTNGEGSVSEMTLAQIKRLDAAYHYRDIRGNYVYRGQGVTIPTVEELFIEFPDMPHLIEIKEGDDSAEEGKMERKLWELIERYQMQDRVIVSSFSDQIIANFQEQAQGRVPVATPRQETIRFTVLHKLYLNRLYRPKSDVLMIPTDSGMFNLADQRLIDGAQRLNMKAIYWTINDEQTMRVLLNMGVDGIITDRPDLLIRVMHEMGLR
jgi:glycerophosphoryl diester phosphodiesterase